MSTQTSGETVSQSEIERLLAQVEGAEQSIVDGLAGGRGVKSENELIQRHEFPKLSFFSGSELRRLRVRHEEFISSLGGRLSIYLGLEVSLQMSKLETLPYQKFTDGLSNPTHLTLLRLEPLEGICLLDIPPHLGLCIVDRELGGPAVSMDEPRELGKMEARLLARVVELIVSEWCSTWSDLYDLKPVLLKHENNGRFLQTCEPETMMLALGIAFRIGDVVDQVQFAFPHFTLEPMMAKLNASVDNQARPSASRVTQKPLWNAAFDDIEIPISAELPDVKVTARQLAALKPGDIIPLPAHLASRVKVRLAETPKYIGSLGVSRGRWAVKISEPIKSHAGNRL